MRNWLILVVLSVALVATVVSAGTLSCTAVSGGSPCPMGSVEVLRLYSTNNTHAALPNTSNAPVAICCNDTTGTNTIITTTNPFIKLAASTNAHVGFVGMTNFTVNANMNGTVEPINCSPTNASCPTNTTCVMRTTGTDNAMAGTCEGSAHPYQLCCGFGAAPTPPVVGPITSASATTGSPSGPAYTFGTYTTEIVFVTLACTPTINGTTCSTFVCSGPTNCTPNVPYTAPFAVTQGGNTTVCYYSTDSANNAGSVTCKTVSRQATMC